MNEKDNILDDFYAFVRRHVKHMKVDERTYRWARSMECNSRSKFGIVIYLVESYIDYDIRYWKFYEYFVKDEQKIAAMTYLGDFLYYICDVANKEDEKNGMRGEFS